MNRAYKLVWNATVQAWVIASELAKGNKKGRNKSAAGSLKVVLGLLGVMGATQAYAIPAAATLPTGESVASGSATFDRSTPNQLTINQSTAKLITNWNSFNVGSAGKVTFAQPGLGAIALNRVTTGSPTEIFGQITANGQLVIVNPNGVTFGAGSQVNASSVVASSLDITDTNFNAGTYVFSRGTATGSVNNHGTIISGGSGGGTVVLLAPSITNTGTVVTPAGYIAMVSANQATLSATTPTIDQASSIAGTITHSGTLNATRASSLGGRVFLSGDKSQSSSVVELKGTISAGERMDIAGKTIKVSNVFNAHSPATTLTADDNILVNGTLNVNVINDVLSLVYGADGVNAANENYTLNRNGKINLNGSTIGFRVNGNTYNVVRDITGLQNLSGSRNVLANDIDATATSGWNAGKGFAPINVSGVLDGLGHKVDKLFINRTATDGTGSNIGLVGSISSGIIQNIGVTNANITGYTNVGALLGGAYGSTGNGSIVRNSYSSGTVSATNQNAGGLIGSVYADGAGQTSSVLNSWSSANVSSLNGSIGGLVGFNSSNNNATALISDSYATGNVSGNTSSATAVGGLVGFNNTNGLGTTRVQRSWASGNATGFTQVGGLVGTNQGVNFSGTGGIAEVTQSYATGGTVTAQYYAGGLVGWNEQYNATGTVNLSYSNSGTVSAITPYMGGVIGFNAGASSTNYWNSSSTGRGSAVGFNQGGSSSNDVSLTTAQMTSLSSFSNWGASINAVGGGSSVWRIYEGLTTPLLRGQLLQTTVTASATKTYDGTNYSGGSYISSDPLATFLGTASYSGASQGAKNVGSYALNISDLYSGQVGYDIILQNGTLTIDKAKLGIGAGNVTKTYDGTTAATGSINVSVGSLFGSDTISGGSVVFANKNAGTSKVVYASGVSVSDGNSGNNYDVYYVPNSTGTINKANLSLSTGNVTKTYDGTTSAAGTAAVSSGTLFAGDTISGGSFAFTNKNAGTGKTVTVSGVTLSDGNSGGNYNVTYVDNTSSTINKANLVLTTSNVTKTYNGTTAAAGTALATGGTEVFSGDTLSGGTFAFTNKNAGTGKTVTTSGVTVNDGNSGGNYNVTYADNTNSTINKANLIISTGNVIKTYDGTTSATGTAVADGGTQVFSGDTLSGGTFAFTNKNAGTSKTVTVSGVTVNDGNSGNNYNVTYANNTGSTINKANLVLTTTDVTKTYDGTTAAAGTATATSGTQVFSGDSLSGGTFAFTNKHAGTGKTVTTSGVTVSDGNSGNNYNVTYANNTSSTINKANLVLTTNNVTKTYDGSTAAAGTATATSGTQVFSGDSLSGGTFAFDNRNAGTGKTVTTTGVSVNDGNSGGNYNVTYADNTASTINKANLVLTTTNVTKTYDGTTTAAGTAVATSGTQVFSGDNLTGGTFAFTNKNAGTGKTVTTTAVSVNDGNSGNNYNVSYADNTNSTINKASLVLTTTDVSKTYDGTNTAAGTAVATSGTQVFSGDSISGGTFTYDTKHAGTGKTVSSSGVTVDDGNSGNNYTVTYADNTNSSIDKASLVLTTTDVTKTYDGTTDAAGTAVATSGTQVFSGDSLSGGTFTYDTKHAGTGKTVSTSGVTVDDGNSGNNYTVTYADNTNSSIDKASLVLTTTDVTKTYDGTTDAAGTAVATSGTQVFSGDSLSGGTFAFDTKHAGTGKTVSTSGVTVDDGNSGNNYTVTYADNTSSTVNKASLVLTTTDVTKTYDGTTDAAGTAVTTSGTQVFSGDSISGGTFTYDTKHAGTGKTVSTSGVTVDDGNSGNNYTVTYADNTNSSIDKATLVLTTTDVTKTYDGTTDAAGTAIATSGTQVFSGDSLTGGTFTYDTKHAGTGKTVSTAAVTVDDGNSGNNYTVTYADNTNSSIDKASLVLTTTDVTKTYDGTNTAAGTAVATSGTQVFSGDSISGGTFVFDTKHAGAGKTVSSSGVTVDDGNSGNNYTVTYADNTNSSIDKASLVLTTTDVTKTYDGTNTAAGSAVATSGTQVFSGDSISGGTFTYDTKHAGSGKTVSTSGVTVDDGNSGNNYTVTYADNTSSSVNKANLSITSSDITRTYDGTTDGSATALVTGGTQVFAGDSISGGTFTFDTKHAGTGKTVSTTGVAVNDGNSGNNYNVTYVANSSNTINKAALVLQAVADNKVYDGLISSANRPLTIGRQRGDNITGLRQEFADKNAGTGKTIHVASGYVVNDGNGGNNYIVTVQDTNTGVITPASLTLTAVTDSKVYDGLTRSTGKPLVSGIITGDRVTALTQEFADKNVGSAKTINIGSGYVIDDGNGGNNYVVTKVSNTTGVITPAALTIRAVNETKVYDGTVVSTLAPVVTGLKDTDAVMNLSQQFADKHVGLGKTINIASGYTIADGNGGNNYTLTILSGTGGRITPKALSITAVANTKVYDGGITSANKPTVTGLVGTDRVTGLFQLYTDKFVGTGKELIIKTGYVLNDGNGGNNYTITEQNNHQGVITAN